ncbi:MAG: hypothetical protein DRJ63_09880 [Thermoprotei archaeon]|nr:MAG: hypothetical protein DRJ63_09880 [Thermoprotei archaeon]
MSLIRGYSLDLKYKFFSVNVSEIVSYLYCPRKLLLVRCLGLRDRALEETIEGVSAHIIYGKLTQLYMEARRSNVDYWRLVEDYLNTVSFPRARELAEFRYRHDFTVAELEVFFKIDGVRGRVDVIEDGVPIEVKYREKVLDRDSVQLAWYGLLIEAVRGVDVDYGYIDLLKSCRRVRIELTDDLREKAVRAREKCIEVIFRGDYSAQRNRCGKCSVLRECRLLKLA